MLTSREKGELGRESEPRSVGAHDRGCTGRSGVWFYFADSDLKSRTLGAVTLPLGVVALISGALLSRLVRSGCTEAAWNAAGVSSPTATCKPCACVSIPFP